MKLNKICEIEDWQRAYLSPYPVHRKNWEYVHLMYGLSALGAVSPDAVVLSVAAGHESPVFLLTNSCRQVHAVDLYGNSNFAGIEAPASMLTNPEAFTSDPFNRRRLVVQHMDALDLRYEDGIFDIVFSLSSIEHFGGTQAARQALQEMERVCRTGGIVCIATEIVVDHGPHFSVPGLVLFTPLTLNELFAAAPTLAPTEEICFDISPGTLGTRLSLDAVLKDREHGIQRFPHIVLETKGRLFTSILVFLRKG